MARTEDRPAPEAFLRAARQEGRGRLKIFLGAAPGVGKTYEMLLDAAGRRAAGIDVVVGVVETHGRRETEALTRGHEIVPPRRIAYEGRTLGEMDLDALLERRPALALVDEFAHSNAPGSRHPKRWQDVEELLAAGIDVYSTVNIQHVESLNDVVASFTRVRVRETVPDAVLEAAEIEVVDIPPDELIERLREGKVYVPEEASRALGHFFSKSNLSALRELALRRAAQAVDQQMLEHLRSHGVAGTWGAGERVVVAVSELPGAEALVRATKRIADAQHAPWTAVHVETRRTARFGAGEAASVARVLALATQLGGAVASVPASDVVEGLKGFAADARATQLVVGKSQRSRWFELRHGSVVDRLVRETPGIAVHVMPGEDGGQRPAAGSPARRAGRGREWGSAGGYAAVVAMVAGVTALGLALAAFLSVGNVALLYLLPVMVSASLFGRGPGLVAGLASSVAYNFFFLPPTGTLTIAAPENVIAVVVLLGVALATSQLTARVRAQADLASSSARANATLAGFLRQLTAATDLDELMHMIAAEIARLFDVRVVMMMAGTADIEVRAAAPPADPMGTMELAAARWALERGQQAGRGSQTLTASDWLFHPLSGGGSPLAVIGLARADGGEPVRSDQLALLAGLLDQAGLALDRLRLEVESRRIAAVEERDRLRAALLSSVGHDLRTPLTAIVAAAAQLDDSAGPALVADIRAEAERLRRFVANLLDMARIEAGAIQLTLDPTDLTDAVAAAVQDVRRTLGEHPLVLDVSPRLPLVRTDPRLLHHCLINLLDNAGRYADPGTPVTVRAERRPDGLVLSVIDEGPGLPAGREATAFETFRRIEGSDRASGGTGLGLAIVKGFAEAFGAQVSAANRTDGRGARFSLTFPETALVRADAEA
ncbi:MAG: DUF4118 domain-containing protein [Janthinobacterium lividum]